MKIMKLSKGMWIIIILIILIGVGVGWSKLWGGERTGKEGMSDPHKTMDVYFFFADWCPHCQKAKPEWQSVKTEKEGSTINGYKVKMTEIDCSGGKNPEIKEYQIKGYPTILVKKEGQVTLFENTPTKDNLMSFLNSF
jgi:thiol-disulfide isomerase/thioredoxin